MPNKKKVAKSKPPKRRDKPTRREQLLATLLRVKSNIDARRDLVAKIPRRGITRAGGPSVPLEFKIHGCGSTREILTGITVGNLDVVTCTLIDELIAELSQG